MLGPELYDKDCPGVKDEEQKIRDPEDVINELKNKLTVKEEYVLLIRKTNGRLVKHDLTALISRNYEDIDSEWLERLRKRKKSLSE